MAFGYKPLWKLLIDKNLKKTDLVVKLGIGKSTLAKMSKNDYVSMNVLDRISGFLNSQLSEIVEHQQNK